MSDTKAADETEPALTLAEFLEAVPPNSPRGIPNVLTPVITGTVPGGQRTVTFPLLFPDLLIHCADEICNGNRIFRPTTDAKTSLAAGVNYRFIDYVCSNCRRGKKNFALRIIASSADKTNGVFTKLGEHPPYGPITPTRLLKLLGDQREMFLQGRRCENQGLGIGAFSYYRRVVEHQKNRIIDEIIKASQTLGVPEAQLDTLRAAKNETQFSKSLTIVKDAIPQALLIKGHNPLTLLHGALSEGLHGRSDEECLEVAQAVRVVLADLSERLSQVLKDEAELNSALTRLLNPTKPLPSAAGPEVV